MLPEIELSEKNVEHPSNRKKCVESARNISILVAAKSNGREKCSSKGVEHQSFTCALEFTIMTVSKKKKQTEKSISICVLLCNCRVLHPDCFASPKR